jgi:hypothetical protein
MNISAKDSIKKSGEHEKKITCISKSNFSNTIEKLNKDAIKLVMNS